MQAKITFKTAISSADFEEAHHLFTQYADSLSLDLSFQNFEAELKTLAIKYNKPEGALVLGYFNDIPVGCVGIRKWDGKIAELKRLYVNPQYRGYGIGSKLLEHAIVLANQLKYQKIRLDTLETMNEAIRLYRSFGFYIIDPYRFNPEPAVYMEKDLEKDVDL